MIPILPALIFQMSDWPAMNLELLLQSAATIWPDDETHAFLVKTAAACILLDRREGSTAKWIPSIGTIQKEG